MKQQTKTGLRDIGLFFLILSGIFPVAFLVLAILPNSPPFVRGAILAAYFFAAIWVWGWRERSHRAQ